MEALENCDGSEKKRYTALFAFADTRRHFAGRPTVYSNLYRTHANALAVHSFTCLDFGA